MQQPPIPETAFEKEEQIAKPQSKKRKIADYKEELKSDAEKYQPEVKNKMAMPIAPGSIVQAKSAAVSSSIIQSSSVKKGQMIMIDGQECMVADVSVAKTGKHGSAKMMVTVIDPVTGMKKEKLMKQDDDIETVTQAKGLNSYFKRSFDDLVMG